MNGKTCRRNLQKKGELPIHMSRPLLRQAQAGARPDQIRRKSNTNRRLPKLTLTCSDIARRLVISSTPWAASAPSPRKSSTRRPIYSWP